MAIGRRQLEKYLRDVQMWAERGIDPYKLHPSVWPGQ